MHEDAFTAMYEQLQRSFPQTDQAIAQIISKGPLGEYLADGLRELAKQGVDVEGLPFQQIHSQT